MTRRPAGKRFGGLWEWPGGKVEQETRLWDANAGVTVSMRRKEEAHDYRYFPDPDLPPLVIAPEWVEQVRAQMPELPRSMAARFVADYGLPEYDATTLTQSKAMASYFEAVALACKSPKLASNWIMGELSRRMNAEDLDMADVASKVHATQLANELRVASANPLEPQPVEISRLVKGEFGPDFSKVHLSTLSRNPRET